MLWNDCLGGKAYPLKFKISVVTLSILTPLQLCPFQQNLIPSVLSFISIGLNNNYININIIFVWS